MMPNVTTDNLISEGRLAFYLKSKLKGKYLVTAQADTQEREVSDLFHDFWRADPQDIFRRLDPDDYYPTYGDDSTTYRDVDTMGRLYLRVDWDKSQVLWGNFDTGITGTEYGQYSRALYGAGLSWRSRRSNAWGDPGSELKVFGSGGADRAGPRRIPSAPAAACTTSRTPTSCPVPSAWRSKYATRPPAGSSNASTCNPVPITRSTTCRAASSLSNPLASVSRGGLPWITRDAPLDGYSQVLLVDYEYVPTGFDPDDVTAGIRGKHWFGDHVGVGVTYVDENRAGGTTPWPVPT